MLSASVISKICKDEEIAPALIGRLYSSSSLRIIIQLNTILDKTLELIYSKKASQRSHGFDLLSMAITQSSSFADNNGNENGKIVTFIDRLPGNLIYIKF
jgi:hypothetical protein